MLKGPEADLIRDNLGYYANLTLFQQMWWRFMAMGMYEAAWDACVNTFYILEPRLLADVKTPDDCVKESQVKLGYSNRVSKLDLSQTDGKLQLKSLDKEVK